LGILVNSHDATIFTIHYAIGLHFVLINIMHARAPWLNSAEMGQNLLLAFHNLNSLSCTLESRSWGLPILKLGLAYRHQN